MNRAPESIGAVVPVNDTVTGERIDHVGDIDEFTANLVAGESYRMFLQTTSGDPNVLLRATFPVGRMCRPTVTPAIPRWRGRGECLRRHDQWPDSDSS